VGKLFAAVLTVITLVSATIFAMHVWWMPPDISVLGGGIDRQISETMVATGVMFVAAQLVLAYFVLRSGDGNALRAIRTFPGGATPMLVFAIVLVGVEILVLTLVGSKVWASIYMTPPEPGSVQIDVQAEQFAYYFRYAGPDGRFGPSHPDKIDESNENYFGLDPANDTTARDDMVGPSLRIPVNKPIFLTLHSKDVGHSFYVPELRIQQDFVPGIVVPLHFTATKIGKYELVCTQLCGLGHYNMRAFVEVISQEEFDQWQKQYAIDNPVQ
jgi:cytochrome c oxidase subunit 2